MVKYGLVDADCHPADPRFDGEFSAIFVAGFIQHMLDKTGYKNRTELAIEARVSGVAISID